MRRVFYEQPNLWRGFIMMLRDAPTSELLNAKHALLRRVVPLVSWFAVLARKSGSSWRLDGSGGHPPLDACLQLLPSSLDIVFLDTLELPPSTTQLLQRFMTLHRLRSYELVEAERLPAALQQMSQLVHLDCSMRTYPADAAITAAGPALACVQQCVWQLAGPDAGRAAAALEIFFGGRRCWDDRGEG